MTTIERRVGSRQQGRTVQTMLRTMTAAATLSLLAGCPADTPAQSPAALASLRQQIDAVRVCAPLLSGTWPIEFSADSLATPPVDALVSAGIVRRVPLPNPGGERPRVRIDLVQETGGDARLYRLRPEAPPNPQLCFGRRQVTTMQHEAMGKRSGLLHYAYRVADAPAWTARPDIRAAFPFMVAMLDGEHRTIGATGLQADGSWRVTGDPQAQGADPMENKGFLP
ncbi:hypothetical protein NU688_13950 [Variovorax sp. ZS18.2.2]|uniref:hypothetical protein n=1 Tax=Variovorax sp. ZS18.2.2 TaxID=2971255 RepID=UPI002151715C|nr:hypothetical protein [Variovorax sp. ZS18.2.2]MCR6477259.1 hypothetical protein [Variovorax sp. ZS18.2.2]